MRFSLEGGDERGRTKKGQRERCESFDTAGVTASSHTGKINRQRFNNGNTKPCYNFSEKYILFSSFPDDHKRKSKAHTCPSSDGVHSVHKCPRFQLVGGQGTEDIKKKRTELSIRPRASLCRILILYLAYKHNIPGARVVPAVVRVRDLEPSSWSNPTFLLGISYRILNRRR